ncbi:MAG TPA: hypothetical protein VHI98_02665 [Vicinamibacterales bacterium]|jgi:uncharacterized protein YoxC|nr:hypothetical protein [Vicinamibacterales bacterium]
MTTSIDTQSTETQARTQDVDSGASLEKVRDLLFGVQMRDYERKFARLEERLLKETGDVREDVRKRLASIEQLIRTEIEALSGRLKGEQDERSKTVKDLSRQLEETARTFEQKTGQLDDQMARALREIRQQLHEQNQRLSDEIRQQADDIVSRLVRESQELRTDKADRATLAALLTDMAMRLTDDLRVPGPADGGRG